MFSVEERHAVYDQARRLVRELDRARTPPPNVPSAEPEALLPVEEAGRAKRKMGDFSEWEDEGDAAEEKDEVHRYIDSQFFWDGEDLLSFWESQSQPKAFPVLSKVARMILCIPATSASSERAFSSAGRVLESRRNRLNPGTVDAILFLHSAGKRLN
ncbi:E3 SUMO-protein ligase ZBED1-like [Melanotaenia boesemani]|uniref:E3 SUMO-protein ligase ZBED1-like n=1 Tax=Melanotaenia boesemani TaxID=1250792 RepID=UPI001C03B6F5|nr:E3 SUMO-protein ligase ZBED1-like [Melanotaenia boesemani]